MPSRKSRRRVLFEAALLLNGAGYMPADAWQNATAPVLAQRVAIACQAVEQIWLVASDDEREEMINWLIS